MCIVIALLAHYATTSEVCLCVCMLVWLCECCSYSLQATVNSNNNINNGMRTRREHSRHTHTMAPAAVATFNEILMCTHTHTIHKWQIHMAHIETYTQSHTRIHKHTRLRICTN